MPPGMVLTLTIMVAYFLVLMAIGYASRRVLKSTSEDYFLASRSTGFIVLLFALFATNQTAFGIIGVPAIGYQLGVGVWGFAASGIGLIAFGYYVIGYRSWVLGRRYHYMTQSEIISDRFGSRLVGILVWALLSIYTVPYIMIGSIGGGEAFSTMTQGVVPYWLGASLPVAVALYYTSQGGMRGTQWTNVFQGAFFTLFFIVAAMVIASNLGGLPAVFDRIAVEAPEKLSREGVAEFNPRIWLSFYCVVMGGAIMFPHLFQRALTARDFPSLKRVILAYPVIYFVGWFPALLIGLMGIVALPGLTGTEVDSVVPAMLAQYLHPAFIGLGLAAIMAAMMSSLDAQLLTLSNIFIRDVLSGRRMTALREIRLARLLVASLATIAFLGALVRPAPILYISEVAFTGYMSLLPVMFAALYWKRANRFGAVASIIVSNLLLWLYFLEIIPLEYRFGFLPSIPVLVTGIVILWSVSLLTPPDERTRIEKVHSPFMNATSDGDQVSPGGEETGVAK